MDYVVLYHIVSGKPRIMSIREGFRAIPGKTTYGVKIERVEKVHTVKDLKANAIYIVN